MNPGCSSRNVVAGAVTGRVHARRRRQPPPQPQLMDVGLRVLRTVVLVAGRRREPGGVVLTHGHSWPLGRGEVEGVEHVLPRDQLEVLVGLGAVRGDVDAVLHRGSRGSAPRARRWPSRAARHGSASRRGDEIDESREAAPVRRQPATAPQIAGSEVRLGSWPAASLVPKEVPDVGEAESRKPRTPSREPPPPASDRPRPDDEVASTEVAVNERRLVGGPAEIGGVRPHCRPGLVDKLCRDAPLHRGRRETLVDEARHRVGLGRRGSVRASPGASHPGFANVREPMAASVSPAERAASATSSAPALLTSSRRVRPST